jgi:sarcosine oxidase delta subunit
MSLHVEISESAFRQRFAQAAKTFPLTLDRYVQRAANEFAKAESWKYRKGCQNWFNSVMIKVAQADYAVLPTARYAAAVNNGGRPHWAPITPLKDWLRVIHRVRDTKELNRRARGLQRFIAAHGTVANPFVERTRTKMDDRVIELLRTGVHTAVTEAYGS